MLNSLNLVGRVVGGIKDKNYYELETIRSFLNHNNEYDVDIFKIYPWNELAFNEVKYLVSGDVVCVKGRIEINDSFLKIIQESIMIVSKVPFKNA